MTEEQRYREQTQLKKDEIQVLKKIADTLVDIRVKLDSALTPNELKELCGMKPIPQSIDNERPRDDIASIRADLIKINEKWRESNACNNSLKKD